MKDALSASRAARRNVSARYVFCEGAVLLAEKGRAEGQIFYRERESSFSCSPFPCMCVSEIKENVYRPAQPFRSCLQISKDARPFVSSVQTIYSKFFSETGKGLFLSFENNDKNGPAESM